MKLIFFGDSFIKEVIKIAGYLPIANGLARSVLKVGDVSFDPGAATGKKKS